MTQAIDYQRITSLITAIEALPQAEQSLLQTMLRDRSIEATPGVCGGHPRLRGTRIPVWILVSLRQQGADETELLRNFPTLTAEHLQQAWSYYDRHPVAIEQAIASHQED
jgi:uncharacterized protein (DUF433 family)